MSVKGIIIQYWRREQCDQIWGNFTNLTIFCKSLGNF